jgi:hypothetical protein
MRAKAVGRCYAQAALIFSSEFLNLGALTFWGAFWGG